MTHRRLRRGRSARRDAAGARCGLHKASGERGHESDPSLVADHGALAASLTFDDLAVETATCFAHVPGSRRQLSPKHGRDERVRVDLAVRMAERDTDLLASVLEDVHVADVGQAAQLAGTIAPDLDQVPDVIDGLPAE